MSLANKVCNHTLIPKYAISDMVMLHLEARGPKSKNHTEKKVFISTLKT